MPCGALTPRLFNLKIGDRIWMSQRAVGNFTYDDSKVPRGADLVLIATGSGLAPFISILETHLRFPPQRRIAIIHGVRHPWDLGYRSLLMAMENLRTNLLYLPVVSPGRRRRSLFPGKVRRVMSRMYGKVGQLRRHGVTRS